MRNELARRAEGKVLGAGLLNSEFEMWNEGLLGRNR
jgi:hypothetical protein